MASNTTTGAKRRRSPLQVAYTNLVKAKARYCKGSVAKAAVKAQASNYIKAATKAGQTTTEAKKKADKVLSRGCSMTSSIAGRKRKATTAKKAASTAGKRKTTTTTRRRATTTARRRKRVAA